MTQAEIDKLRETLGSNIVEVHYIIGSQAIAVIGLGEWKPVPDDLPSPPTLTLPSSPA